MNNSIIAANISRSSSISVYTSLQPSSEEPVALNAFRRSTSSWQKFIHRSPQHSVSESAMMVVPVAETTTDGPVVFEPASLPEDYDASVEEFLRFLDSFESETEPVDDRATEQE